MEFISERSKQKVMINEWCFSAEQARAPQEGMPSYIELFMENKFGKESFFADLAHFLREWFDESELLQVQTSGSTGKPKKLMVEKERMMNSARMTLNFLGLKAGDSALLCMPLAYIAGKMVVVRALLGGLKLVVIPPCSNPMLKLMVNAQNEGVAFEAPTFAAMIPMQVFNGVNDEQSLEGLKQIKQLIIGGGAVDSDLNAKLNDFPHGVWSTYGMTETLSHIALRKLNLGQDNTRSLYEPFEGVKLSQTELGALIIDAPLVCAEQLVTNDIVRFDEQGRFEVIGRLDNVINSGGVKIQIEEVETKLKERQTELIRLCEQEDSALTCDGVADQDVWENLEFVVAPRPDAKFGQVVTLLYTFKDGAMRSLVNDDWEQLFTNLPPYWVPKCKFMVEELPRTGTGKVDRAKAKELAAAQ